MSVQKNRDKPVRNTAKEAQNALLACPCLPLSFKSTHLLSGVLEGSCLAQSDNNVTTIHTQEANAFWEGGAFTVKQTEPRSDKVLALHPLGNNY